MFNFRTFVVASTAFSIISGASAIALKRNEEPPAPSCVSFTPFVYAGCFSDPSSPRALLYDSGLNTQNMTVETCVAFCKGNKYKYAGLEYYGECFCGATVGGQQIAESNCNFPCTGNSGETCGGNDIISIYQDPTFPTIDNSVISDYKSLGCYSEGTTGRSLAWQQDQVSATTITVESCLFACKAGGYSFAGLEYGSQCFCGEVLGNGTLPIASTTCNMNCAGNSAETCGGRSALNLYVATDLESSQPCGYVPPVVSTTTTSTSSSSTSTSSSSSSSTTTTSTSVPPSKPTTTSTTKSTPTSTTSTSVPPSKPTTTSSTTKSMPTTTTTPPSPSTTSLCSSVVTVSPPAPTCEYKCGGFCSNPVPTFSDKNSCAQAVSSCAIQVASCFFHAGFPASLNCFQFSSWCTSLQSYCNNNCGGWGGKCSKPDCYSKNPPQGYTPPSPPTVSTTTFPCSAAPTSTKPTTTQSTCVPVPTATNICNQPHNPGKGYTSTNPVGSVPLPCLTCNNVLSDYQAGNCFKLYSVKDTYQCPSYGRGGGNGPTEGCKAACDAQYYSCTSTYAQSCKNNWGWFGGDSFNTAQWKCQQQWQDCYNTNQGVTVNNRCGSFNQGWF